MRIANFEIRIRLDVAHQDEAKAILEARRKLMDVAGVLSSVQIGPVDDTLSQSLVEEARSR